jgi:hypothetical protein
MITAEDRQIHHHRIVTGLGFGGRNHTLVRCTGQNEEYNQQAHGKEKTK